MLDFLTKIFRREESSKSLAKERLRLVLMSDRVALAPDTFNLMKGEMLSVLQRYLDIDEQGMDVHFENAERRFALYANIPITNIKSSEEIQQERQRVAVGGNGIHAGHAGTRRRRRRRRRSAAETNGGPTPPASPEPYTQASNGTTSGTATPDEPTSSL